MDWFWYRLDETGSAVLLRAFGTQPVVFLPERLDGHPVAEISEYCFSEKEKYTGEEDFIFLTAEEVVQKDEKEIPVRASGEERRSCFFQLLKEKKICALAGDFITDVTLSSTVKRIGALAFYQCRHLESITFSFGEFELGGDAFMNCRSLRRFYFHASPQKPTALRQVLAQQSVETECYFLSPEDETVMAAFLFPEYSERYDLIGPAHIFELNIEGEGFRARQCFENGVFLFSKYDRIFLQAVDTEETGTLCSMAVLRLTYPMELAKEEKKAYRTYLLSHLEYFFDWIIKERELTLFRGLAKQGYIGKKELGLLLKKAVNAQWAEGIRLLLMWKKEWWEEKEEDAYGFEDF